MINKLKKNNFRVIGLYLFVFLISMLVVVKVIKVQQFDKLINTNSQPRFFSIEAPRGNILADDGSLLAISMPLYNVYLDLGVIGDKLFEKHVEELAFRLSELFGNKNAKEYEDFLRASKKSKKNRYVRLKLKVNHNQLLELKRMPILKLNQNLGGLIAEPRPHREAPFGELAHRTIGEDREINPVGIERAYDPFLSGQDGKHLKRKIAHGVWILQDSPGNKIPKPGNDIVTTINIDMQDVAQKALERTLVEENAEWGCIVLMQVETGEVKVIANLKKDSLDRVSEYFNYAMAEHVAPGSTFKLASVIAGLEDGKFKVNDLVNLKKGRIKYYDRVMIDSPHDFNNVSIKKAFEISSNVGISSIINENYKKDPSAFTDRIYKMGLSTPLDLELPYPSSLMMPSPNSSSWSGVTLPWMSTGYEMALTPLHILTFYNAIANGGKMMNPIFTSSIVCDGIELNRILPKVINPAICSKSTINQIMPLLKGVVENGTAKNIKSLKYSIAGKTGTTVLNYADRKKGEEKMYQASFVGFFPADKPKYSCIVVINKPRNGNVYGGRVAAPIFKELADKVFAIDIDIHKDISDTDLVTNFPTTKKGAQEKIDFVLKALNISKDYSSNDLDSVAFFAQIDYDLSIGIMPDLLGMSIDDAVWILEKYGLKVKINNSSGEVSRQSIKKGRKIIKGNTVKLELS